MFRTEMAGSDRVRAWVTIAIPLVVLALAVLTVAPDFASLPAVFHTAHRTHLPTVGPAVLILLTRPFSASLYSPTATFSHRTMHDRVIDLTCSRLC
jgi:hypothetical protein